MERDDTADDSDHVVDLLREIYRGRGQWTTPQGRLVLAHSPSAKYLSLIQSMVLARCPSRNAQSAGGR